MNWFSGSKFAALPPRLENNPNWFRQWKDMVVKTIDLLMPKTDKVTEDHNAHYIENSFYCKSLGSMSFGASAHGIKYDVHLSCRKIDGGDKSYTEWVVNVWRTDPVKDVLNQPQRLWDVGPYDPIKTVITIINEDKDVDGGDEVNEPTPETPVGRPQPVLASTKLAAMPSDWVEQWNTHMVDAMKHLFDPFLGRKEQMNPSDEPMIRMESFKFRPEKLGTAFVLTAKNANYQININRGTINSSTMISVIKNISYRPKAVANKVSKNGEPFEISQIIRSVIDNDFDKDNGDAVTPEPSPSPNLVHASVKTASIVGPARYMTNHRIDFLKQDTKYTCGPAAVQNIFRILRKEIPSEADLAKALRCSPEGGTDALEIQNLLKKTGIRFRRFDASHDKLEDILKNNNIVLVEYQDYQEEYSKEEVKEKTASHFAVVVGYDKASYYLVDPYHPIASETFDPFTQIPREKFLSHWMNRSFDGTHLVQRYGLIIPTLGSH